MAKEQDGSESRQEAQKQWVLTRSTTSTATPASTPASAADAAAQQDPRLDTSRTPPKELPHLSGKLDPVAFQANFPQNAGGAAEHATVSEAFKTIKPEELLTVTQTPCARDGFIGGILTGAFVGGVRFIMRAPIPKVANWAVGGALSGAVASYEYCQWKRRQERVRMKRAVEVYQGSLAEKHRREYEARVAEKEAAAEAAKANAEVVSKRAWYKFW